MIVVMIVIVIIPIAICTPAMAILVPPTVVVLPAIGARLRQFCSIVLRFGTIPTMVFRRFVQLVIGPYDALLAVVVGTKNGRAGGKKKRAESKGREKASRRLGSGSWIDDHRFSKEVR